MNFWKPDVISSNDYYSFGQSMPGRNFNASTYKFSFNGKLDDAEVEGQQDYGMRIYDKRLGRFKSVDPLSGKFPHLILVCNEDVSIVRF
ncbi:MAG: hypothetical protein J0M08_10065 [Bacteroidetes bacterium]|nr:hypothetical protein [Bacteroidota bacterium]